MLLYLMQHGACFSKEVDPDQPLSPVGREAVERAAKAARGLGCRFDLVLASPKLRSAQTASLVARAVGYPESDIQVTESVKAMASAKDTAALLERSRAKSAFIAGHLPHLAKLAALVCSDGSADIVVENAGLTLVEITSFEPVMGRLRWHLPPAALHLMHAE